MKKVAILITSLFFFFAFTNNKSTGKSITFSEDIAPIIYENCSGCHHAGGIVLINFLQ